MLALQCEEMHKQLDYKCSSRGSIYIHEEGRSDGVIDS